MTRSLLSTPPAAALLALALALSALAAPTRAAAQDPAPLPGAVANDTVYEVRLQDGSVLFGRIVGSDFDNLVLLTETGLRVEIARSQIRSASPVRGSVREGEVWVEDPNRTRLFFGPTGRALRAGEGYVGAFQLFLPFAAFGITDRVTIAGGTPIIPGVMGRILYFAPKVQVIASERASASAGVLAFVNMGLDSGDEADVVGIAYGAGTWGSEDRAFSAGAGWAFSGDEFQNRPAFMLGGETRVSRRAKLISENYLITWSENVYDYDPNAPDQVPDVRREARALGLLGAGVRLFGERLSGDLGVGMAVGNGVDFSCCIPLVNFVYNFSASPRPR